MQRIRWSIDRETWDAFVARMGIWRGSLVPVLERAWEDDACVCPFCRAACAPRDTAGAAPRCAHGISRDDQPELMLYWETSARKDDAAMHRSRARLLLKRPDPKPIARLRALFNRCFANAQDLECPALKRYVGGLVVMAACCVPCIGLLGSPPFSTHPWILAVAMPIALFAAPFVMMAAWSRKTAQPRCAACRHMLAAPYPERCPECAADLANPYAVSTVDTSTPVGPILGVIAIVCAPLLGFLAWGLFLAFGGLSSLPSSMLLPMASGDGPTGVMAREVLDRRTLAASEAAEYADLVVSLARDQPHLFTSLEAVVGAVKARSLPEEKLDEALRACVGFNTSLDAAGFPRRPIRFTPRYSNAHFGLLGSPVIVLESVTFDSGGAVVKDIDPRGPALGADGLEPIVVHVPAGARRASWRARIYLVPLGSTLNVTLGPSGEHLGAEGVHARTSIEGEIELPL
jgi:hypothetical protein